MWQKSMWLNALPLNIFRGVSYKITCIKVQMFLNITCYHHCIIIPMYDKRTMQFDLVPTTHTYCTLIQSQNTITHFLNSFITLTLRFLSFLKKFIFSQPCWSLACIYNTIWICAAVRNVQLVANPPKTRSLLNLEDIDLARVFQRLSPVAEPNSHNLPVIV